MKKSISPQLKIGLLIFVTYIIIDKFITTVPNIIAIPLLIVAIILVLMGGFKGKNK